MSMQRVFVSRFGPAIRRFGARRIRARRQDRAEVRGPALESINALRSQTDELAIRVIRGADKLIIVVADAVTSAEDRLSGAGEDLTKEAFEVRRPGEANRRPKVVLIGLRKIAGMTGVTAQTLINPVGVQCGLDRTLTGPHLGFEINQIRVVQWSVQVIAQAEVQC